MHEFSSQKKTSWVAVSSLLFDVFFYTINQNRQNVEMVRSVQVGRLSEGYPPRNMSHSFNAVLTLHDAFNLQVTDTKGYTDINFNDRTDHKEGWWTGVYTHSRQTVYPRCSKDKQSPINKCGILMYIRADGKKPSSWTPFNVYNVSQIILSTR